MTPTGQSDAVRERKLIARAKSGDEAAIRTLVASHKDRLYAFIWRMIRNEHDAEDICQDAFLKAFSSLASFSTEYRFSTWLFTIAYRVCLNRLRRKSMASGDLDAGLLAESAEDSPGEVFESREAGELRVQVWQAVDRLSMPQRAAVVLFYRHELSCQEIARVLELPVATVKSHLHRARARLRQILEQAGESELQDFRNRSVSAG